MNPAKRHMARAPTPTMLAAITAWKKCSTMIGGERAGREATWSMVDDLASFPFCKNSQAEVEFANTRRVHHRQLWRLYLCNLLWYNNIICLILKVCISPFIWDMAA